MINFNNEVYYIKNQTPTLITACDVTKDLDNDSNVILIYENENELFASIYEYSIYSILHNDDLYNITVITSGEDSTYITFVFDVKSEFEDCLYDMKKYLTKTQFSAQNIKITSYAKSVVSKLRIGTKVMIIDAKTDDGTVECPSCGVINDFDPAMPYCLECGAPLK